MRRPPPRSLFPHLAACTGLAVLLLASTASAQSWGEVGDAGDLIATAQSTTGSGPLNTITGHLLTDTDVDIFCITVTNPTTFSACLLCTAQADPSLWLFRANGTGVALNDLCQASCKQIPPGFVSTAGTYYLAVSPEGHQAQSAGGAMWLTGLFTGVRAPDGAGAAGSLTGWSGPGVATLANYTINLNGAGYCSGATPALTRTWGTLKAHYR
jgi:hypothetical protein